jgi:hypothetical protein
VRLTGPQSDDGRHRERKTTLWNRSRLAEVAWGSGRGDARTSLPRSRRGRVVILKLVVVSKEASKAAAAHAACGST